jgi:hypothetical protein
MVKQNHNYFISAAGWFSTDDSYATEESKTWSGLTRGGPRQIEDQSSLLRPAEGSAQLGQAVSLQVATG